MIEYIETPQLKAIQDRTRWTG